MMQLCQMATSRNVNQRLLALMLMQQQAGQRKLQSYLDFGRDMIDDLDNDCRWQALILVGKYIQTKPKVVWETVKKYGVSDDDDMRAGVASVLLEHLIEHHPSYRRLSERIARKSKPFEDTLRMCWDFSGETL